MPEDPTPSPATAPEAPATEAKAAPAAAPKEAAAAPQEVDWAAIETALDSAPPEKLRSLRRVQGIVGERLQTAQQTWVQQQQAENARLAAEKAEQELLEMAQARPLEFAEKYLTQKEQERLKRQLDDLKSTTSKSLLTQIGKSFGEQFELTPDDVAEISKSLAGKTDDEVLPTFNNTAARIVARKEAEKLFAEWRDKELPKEREAIRQEVSAKHFSKSSRPQIAKPSAPPTIKPHQLPPDEFNAWYEKNVLKRSS